MDDSCRSRVFCRRNIRWWRGLYGFKVRCGLCSVAGAGGWMTTGASCRTIMGWSCGDRPMGTSVAGGPRGIDTVVVVVVVRVVDDARRGWMRWDTVLTWAASSRLSFALSAKSPSYSSVDNNSWLSQCHVKFRNKVL